MTQFQRTTKETDITLDFELRGQGEFKGTSHIGFFDHMLTLLCKHAGWDITLSMKGDLEVDDHHSIEDVGIVIGLALKEALKNKTSLTRYGDAFLPMDEALAHVCVDISGRATLVYNVTLDKVMLGTMSSEMVKEFFKAIAHQAELTLHMRLLYGDNTHHCVEALFKGFARAIKKASTIDASIVGVLSTKGVL
ncbi:MAG: imidazoleglycerol-phosphate dehydratase HisB [Erysipelothrix sp.]|nr:imidazoleglycerol-phosphate dehydratase HisB [Erysipelothrix sp.]